MSSPRSQLKTVSLFLSRAIQSFEIWLSPSSHSGVLGMLREYEGVESVTGGGAGHPGSAARASSCGAGDLEVTAQIEFEGVV